MKVRAQPDLIERTALDLDSALDRLAGLLTGRHYGPGPHPGTGTPQEVHAGDDGQPLTTKLTAAMKDRFEEWSDLANIPASISLWLLPDGTMVRSRGEHRDNLDAVELADDKWNVMTLAEKMDYALAEGFARFSVGRVMRGFAVVQVKPNPPRPVRQSIRDVLRALGPDASIIYDVIGRGSGQDIAEFERQSGINVFRHYGPGPHPGTGSPQDIHGKRDQPHLSEWEPIADLFRRYYGNDPLADPIPLNASWISPSGEDLAHGQDHGETAEAVLSVHEGVDYGERDAVFRLVEKYGFLRLTSFGSEYAVTLPPDLTNAQRDMLVSLIETEKAKASGLEWTFDRISNDQRESVKADEIAREWRLDHELFDISLWTIRHYGPGRHPGTGTAQDVHAGDRQVAVKDELRFGRRDRFESQNVLIEKFALEMADQDTEIAYLFHPDREDFLRIFDDGSPKSVVIHLGDDEESQFPLGNRAFGTIHNHPDGTTLSRQDFTSSLDNGEAESHVATRANGQTMVYSFIWRRPIPGSVRDAMVSTMFELTRKRYRDLEEQVGQVNDKLLWHEHNHRTWQVMSDEFSDYFSYHVTEIDE